MVEKEVDPVLQELYRAVIMAAHAKLEELRKHEPKTDLPVLHKRLEEVLGKAPPWDDVIIIPGSKPILKAFLSLIEKSDMKHLQKGNAEALITILGYLPCFSGPRFSFSNPEQNVKDINLLYKEAVKLAIYERKANEFRRQADELYEKGFEPKSKEAKKWLDLDVKARLLSADYHKPHKELLSNRGGAVLCCDHSFIGNGLPVSFLRPQRTSKIEDDELRDADLLSLDLVNNQGLQKNAEELRKEQEEMIKEIEDLFDF